MWFLYISAITFSNRCHLRSIDPILLLLFLCNWIGNWAMAYLLDKVVIRFILEMLRSFFFLNGKNSSTLRNPSALFILRWRTLAGIGRESMRSVPLAVLFPALIWDLSHTNTADSHATSAASSSARKPQEPQKASNAKKMPCTQEALHPRHPRWTWCSYLAASVRQTEKKALWHPPLTPSHQALPVPQKRAITAQPVAELYVLNIYLFIYFLFVCVCWKASQLSTRRGPTVLQVNFFHLLFCPFFFSLFLHLKVAGSPFMNSVFQVGPVALKSRVLWLNQRPTLTQNQY